MGLARFDKAAFRYKYAKQIPHSDERTGALFNALWTIVVMSEKRLPEGVELGDLSYLYQMVMEEFDFLQCCDDLSAMDNAILKGIMTNGWDKIEFRHH